MGEGDASQKPVELLVVSEGQLKVTRDDPGLLVVPGSVAGELEDLGSEVLHDGGEVDRSSSSKAIGVATLAEKTVNPSHRELKTSTAGPGLSLGLNFSSFAASGHFDCLVFGYKLMAVVSGAGLISPPPAHVGRSSHRAGARALCGVTRLSRKTV